MKYMVITTIDDEEKAYILGQKLTEKKIAACAQISGPITSYYWWKNAIQKDKEWRIVFKTNKTKKEIEQAIQELHPYSIPQLVFINIETSENYGKWIQQVLS